MENLFKHLSLLTKLELIAELNGAEASFSAYVYSAEEDERNIREIREVRSLIILEIKEKIRETLEYNLFENQKKVLEAQKDIITGVRILEKDEDLNKIKYIYPLCYEEGITEEREGDFDQFLRDYLHSLRRL